MVEVFSVVSPQPQDKCQEILATFALSYHMAIIQGDSWRMSFLQGIDLSCHADEKSSYEQGSDFSYYKWYEVYNIWNWITINWSNQSNYWLKWYWMVHWKVQYLLHYYSCEKCVLQYIFKHSAFSSNTGGRTGVNRSSRIANSNVANPKFSRYSPCACS